MYIYIFRHILNIPLLCSLLQSVIQYLNNNDSFPPRMLWLQVHNVYAILADQALSFSYVIDLFRASSLFDIPLTDFSSNQHGVVFPSLSSCFLNGALTAPYVYRHFRAIPLSIINSYHLYTQMYIGTPCSYHITRHILRKRI